MILVPGGLRFGVWTQDPTAERCKRRTALCHSLRCVLMTSWHYRHELETMLRASRALARDRVKYRRTQASFKRKPQHIAREPAKVQHKTGERSIQVHLGLGP